MHFSDKSSEGLCIAINEIENVAALAEVWPFRSDEQGADVTGPGSMNRLLKVSENLMLIRLPGRLPRTICPSEFCCSNRTTSIISSWSSSVFELRDR
jgi:hypothetical protein